jgi:hypothetical protein
MTEEVIALALTLGVHLLGAFALIGVLIRDSDADPRGWWPGDDDDGPPRGGDDTPEPPSGGGDGLPLSDAAPSRVRLRDADRIADGYPRPRRRPEHAPERAPAREREPA